MSAQFDTLWDTLVKDSTFELPDELKENLRNALRTSSYGESHKVKRVSGYNLYFSDAMKKLKEEGVDANERMTKVNAQWKVLPEADKKAYAEKAKAQSAGAMPAKARKSKKGEKPSKLTGYQYFIKMNMGTVSTTTDENGGPKDRMKRLANKWSALSDEQKANWRQQADNAQQEATDNAQPEEAPATQSA